MGNAAVEGLTELDLSVGDMEPFHISSKCLNHTVFETI